MVVGERGRRIACGLCFYAVQVVIGIALSGGQAVLPVLDGRLSAVLVIAIFFDQLFTAVLAKLLFLDGLPHGVLIGLGNASVCRRHHVHRQTAACIVIVGIGCHKVRVRYANIGVVVCL